jgi:hypothetical protein
MPTTPIESRNDVPMDRCMLPPKHASGAIIRRKKSRPEHQAGALWESMFRNVVPRIERFRSKHRGLSNSVAGPGFPGSAPHAEFTVHGFVPILQTRASIPTSEGNFEPCSSVTAFRKVHCTKCGSANSKA